MTFPVETSRSHNDTDTLSMVPFHALKIYGYTDMEMHMWNDLVIVNIINL